MALPSKYSIAHAVTVVGAGGHPVRPVDVNGVALDDSNTVFSIAHPVLETDASGVVVSDSTKSVSTPRLVTVSAAGTPVITVDSIGNTLGAAFGAVIDTTAPTITSSNPSGSYTQGTGVGGTLTASESVTWSVSGVDAASVTLNASTGVWSLADTVGTFSFSFTATDLAGNPSSIQSVSITITAASSLATAPTLAASSASGTSPLVLEWSYSGTDDIVGLYGQLEVSNVLNDTVFASGTITQNIVFFIDGDSWARLDEAVGLITPSGDFSARIRLCRDNDSGATTITGTDPQGNAISFTADVSSWSNVYSDTITVSVAVLDAAHKESHVVLSNGNLTATMPIHWGVCSSARATIEQVNDDGYFECTFTLGTDTSKNLAVGIIDGTFAVATAGNQPGSSSALGCSYRRDGVLYHDATNSTLPSWPTGAKIGVRLNKTTKVVTFYVNGVAQATTVTLSSCTTFYAVVSVFDTNDTITVDFDPATKPSGASMYG